MQALEHIHLIINHLLIALDTLLHNNLDGNLPLGPLGFTDNAVGTSTQGPPKLVLGPVSRVRKRA